MKGREGKGREGKGREGKRREGKGREGKGREEVTGIVKEDGKNENDLRDVFKDYEGAQQRWRG